MRKSSPGTATLVFEFEISTDGIEVRQVEKLRTDESSPRVGPHEVGEHEIGKVAISCRAEQYDSGERKHGF
jgi:hypothetical protein